MTMETVELQDAQRRLGELLSLARAGTEVVIAENGKPRVRLVPLGELAESDRLLVSPGTPAPSSGRKRIAGLNRGSVIWISDDFDAPLPDEFWLGDESSPR
jgi:prevent-host-death family protein